MKRFAPARLFAFAAAARADVFLSTDGGKTWTAAGLEGDVVGTMFQPDPDGKTELRETEDDKTWKVAAGPAKGMPVALAGTCDGKALWLGTK